MAKKDEIKDLETKTTVLETEVTKLQEEKAQLESEILEYSCKIGKINEAIAERFDQDGVNDIKLPTGDSWWEYVIYVISNGGTIFKFVNEIIDIVKNPCTTQPTA